MLQQPAPFPHPGSTAYTRGTAGRVTIIQRNADGTATVKLHPPAHLSPDQRIAWHARGASLTSKIDARDLYATELEATFCGKVPAKLRRAGRRR